jgi:hypothetical protein
VPAALGDLEDLILSDAHHAIHEAVFPRDPARPPPFEIATQRLDLPDARDRRSHADLDQVIDADERVFVGRLSV